MKLQQINENMVMQQIRGMLQTAKPSHPQGLSLYNNRPQAQTSHLYNDFTGHDAGAANAGFTFMPSGIPHNPRHRTYLGMEKRLGAIRL